MLEAEGKRDTDDSTKLEEPFTDDLTPAEAVEDRPIVLFDEDISNGSSESEDIVPKRETLPRLEAVLLVFSTPNGSTELDVCDVLRDACEGEANVPGVSDMTEYAEEINVV